MSDGYRTERALCLLAPNPSPMTLDGTNTWILAEPGASHAVVVDPGPADEGHLRRVAAAVHDRGQCVGAVLLTHTHPDHAAGAAGFAGLTGAPVYAADPSYRLGGTALDDGDTVEMDGLRLEILATPGHSSDSRCLLLRDDRALLTGDTVLGRGTSVIADTGGLADYLGSLSRLRTLAVGREVRRLLPGHGPPSDDPLGMLDYYIDHRHRRLEQVDAALAAGDRTSAHIVQRIYGDLDTSLRHAAERSVQAHLDYIRVSRRSGHASERTRDA